MPLLPSEVKIAGRFKSPPDICHLVQGLCLAVMEDEIGFNIVEEYKVILVRVIL